MFTWHLTCCLDFFAFFLKNAERNQYWEYKTSVDLNLWCSFIFDIFCVIVVWAMTWICLKKSKKRTSSQWTLNTAMGFMSGMFWVIKVCSLHFVKFSLTKEVITSIVLKILKSRVHKHLWFKKIHFYVNLIRVCSELMSQTVILFY